MGSFPGSSEIVEAEDEPSSSRNGKGVYQQNSPRYKDVLEYDINKLFEAISIKTSKGFALSQQSGSSPLNKNTSKRPITVGTPRSPGFGNLEPPATLKQALRELSLTKASEMAAMRRLSKMASSNGPSEAGRIKTLYNTVVLESRKPSLSLDEPRGDKVEISLVLEPPNQSSDSSPRLAAKHESTKSKLLRKEKHGHEPSPSGSDHGSEAFEIVDVPAPAQNVSGSGSTRNESGIPTVKSVPVEKEKRKSELVPSKTLEPVETVPNSTKSRNKPSSSSRTGNKNRSHSGSLSAAGGNRVSKLSRTNPRLMKSVSRNRSLAKKKIKPDISGFDEVEPKPKSDPSKGQLVCERCHCTMKTASKKPPEAVADPTQHTRATKKNTKLKEKGEIFSQSEYSSSTTTTSDESNLSASSCGNRPHMSKDARWEAIRQALSSSDGVLGLDHFNLLKKLGCGDIGTVYLAELIATNCLFAIKVMDNEFLARRKKMPRAQTEREILRMLDHPFLPTLYSQFTSDNLLCLVMEYCPGGDLHVLRQKQPGRNYSESAARFYVAEVLLALEYLHMLGVVYRDLKPENVLVREDGHIMLTDFDLSLRCSVNPTLLQSYPSEPDPVRRSGPCTESSCVEPFCIEPSCHVPCFTPRLLPGGAAAKTKRISKPDAATALRSLPQLVAEPTEARSNSFVGTHEYLAPEIIKGDGHGSAVDWWTFGVFLYELLYGRTPFKGGNNEETLANVVLQTLKFPDSPMVSFQARDLIRGLLVKEPAYRFGTEKGAAEIKQHPFFEGLNWALIRCAAPPDVPEFCEFEVPNPVVTREEKEGKYLECKATGELLEFELF